MFLFLFLFLFSDKIFSKLGYVHCMTLSLFLNAVRLLAYSLLNQPIWALLISMLDGFTFGITYATIASYSNLISTSDSKTTTQATFNSIFDGIGNHNGIYLSIFKFSLQRWMFTIQKPVKRLPLIENLYGITQQMTYSTSRVEKYFTVRLPGGLALGDCKNTWT